MSEPIISHYMSIDEYLAAEAKASVRHEYVRGRIFAMTGATDAHNIICGNLFAPLHSFLRGGPCIAYANDMKVHVEIMESFYYPDIMVSCEPLDPSSVFKCTPRLIVEVLSPSTRLTDRREKLVAYQQLASLMQYVVIEQKRYLVESHTRLSGKDWQTTALRSRDDTLILDVQSGKKFEIGLNQIYERLSLPLVVEEPEAEYELV